MPYGVGVGAGGHVAVGTVTSTVTGGVGAPGGPGEAAVLCTLQTASYRCTGRTRGLMALAKLLRVHGSVQPKPLLVRGNWRVGLEAE